jgi:hypothetical protein
MAALHAPIIKNFCGTPLVPFGCMSHAKKAIAPTICAITKASRRPVGAIDAKKLQFELKIANYQSERYSLGIAKIHIGKKDLPLVNYHIKGDIIVHISRKELY